MRFGALALAMTLAAASGCAHKTATAATPSDAAPAVPTSIASYGTFTTQVQGQGRVGPPAGGESKLTFAVPGIIASIDVHVGQSVAAGEALAQLDTSGFAIDLTQAKSDARAAAAGYGGGAIPSQAARSAQAKLIAAQARLASLQNGTGTAQSDARSASDAVRQSLAKVAADQQALEREARLYAGGVAAAKDVEAARQQLALDRADADANRSKAASAAAGIGGALTQARADVSQARSDLRTAQGQVSVQAAQLGSSNAKVAAAQRMLANATLVSPANGVVTAILKHVGESADSSSPVITVGPPTANAATVSIVGSASYAVHVGDPVTTVVAERSAEGHGTVRAIVRSVDPATQTTTVVVDGVPRDAAPGDAVQATIDVGRRRGIIIPTSALVQDPQSGKTVVFVRERAKDGSEKFAEREVDVASGNDARTVVASGLRRGEIVASEGAFDLLAPAGGG